MKNTDPKSTEKAKFPTWTNIPWDGNPALNLRCWRKTFGHGHVSVGIGDFTTIVYSYGANSDNSLSSTRSRPHYTVNEHAAMEEIDRNGGRHYPSKL